MCVCVQLCVCVYSLVYAHVCEVIPDIVYNTYGHQIWHKEQGAASGLGRDNNGRLANTFKVLAQEREKEGVPPTERVVVAVSGWPGGEQRRRGSRFFIM